MALYQHCIGSILGACIRYRANIHTVSKRHQVALYQHCIGSILGASYTIPRQYPYCVQTIITQYWANTCIYRKRIPIEYRVNFTLFPGESLEIKNHMLSDYFKKFNIKVGRVKKLVPNLGPKKNYVLHYKNLKQYLDLGLKVTKVYCALEFDQSPWLKTYIDFNIQKRTAAKSSFEKGFFKLMNNSVFGKTIENLRKRVNVTLINDPEKLLKHASEMFLKCFEAHFKNFSETVWKKF